MEREKVQSLGEGINVIGQRRLVSRSLQNACKRLRHLPVDETGCFLDSNVVNQERGGVHDAGCSSSSVIRGRDGGSSDEDVDSPSYMNDR